MKNSLGFGDRAHIGAEAVRLLNGTHLNRPPILQTVVSRGKI